MRKTDITATEPVRPGGLWLSFTRNRLVLGGPAAAGVDRVRRGLGTLAGAS